MDQIKKYVIPLANAPAADAITLKALSEANAALFDRAILSVYGGDIRYAVVENSFKVTEISAEKINYLCQVNYFAPCHDQNDIFEVKGSANYTLTANEIILSLDETLWNVD